MENEVWEWVPLKCHNLGLSGKDAGAIMWGRVATNLFPFGLSKSQVPPIKDKRLVVSYLDVMA